jgi:hypothetical protein
MDGVIQPVHEDGPEGAIFDRLPAGEFQVVVVIGSGDAQRVRVSLKDRARIESPLLGMIETPPTETTPPPHLDSVPKAAATTLRLFVQGDGKHLSDTLGSLQEGLASAGITGAVVARGEPYDYLIIFGEAERDAAAAIALDRRGNLVAVAVRRAFTGKGAADGAGRDLGEKLAALSR